MLGTRKIAFAGLTFLFALLLLNPGCSSHAQYARQPALRELAKMLRRELLLVQDVAKIDFWGDRPEVVYVEPDRERTAQLGVSQEAIGRELRSRNLVSDSGRVQVGNEYIAIEPTGIFDSVEAMGELLITADSGEQFRLRDIAQIRRGYAEPAPEILRYDGNVAIGIGISTVVGGNVVEMGEAIEARMQELRPQIQLGMEFGIISLQSEAVVQSIQGFTSSLVQAVAIVVVVLLLFMGLRSGLLIGFVLVLTIGGSFPFLGAMDVALERISLGALIIALGMLVDNAIVVVDGMLVRIQGGQDADDAARTVVAQTAVPLLGATAVAIMAFAAIGTSDDSTGEFCRSLYQVVFVSLGLSWVTAMTVTPVLGALILPAAAGGDAGAGASADPYDTSFYRGYRSALSSCIRFRWVTVAAVLAIFAVSLMAFGRVDRSFFPDSTRPQFMVDFWLPQGTHIDETVRRAEEVERYLLGLEGATHVSSVIGNGAMRFLLTYAPEKRNSAYAQFLVDVDDSSRISPLMEQAERGLAETQPDALVYSRRFVMGPGDGGKIQIRIRGPESDVLRELAAEVETILFDDGGAKGVRSDWRQRTKQLRPVIAADAANRAGVTRSDIAQTLRAAFDGVRVGVYRERDELLPIVVRAPEEERTRVVQILNLQIWSPVANAMIPLRQVVTSFETTFEDDIIVRYNRTPTLTVHADPVSGPANRLLARVRPKVEALELSPGYEIAWWGEVKSSADAQAGLSTTLPFFLGAMVLIVIALFNSLRQPAAIFLTVPLALIGVSWGLLATGQPFGFMALLGFLSLSGMLIKNAIVLVDEIEIQKREGLAPIDAILSAGVSRLRPVSMAALTTAMGMIPLLFDAFFVAMAVTIISGLVVATVLTMVVVPVLYAILFQVRSA